MDLNSIIDTRIKRPKLIKGIRITDNESLWGRIYYIMSCEDKGIYIRIPPEKVKYFEYAIESMDGQKSIQDLELDFHHKFNRQVDVLGLIKLLANSGFVEGYNPKSSELDTFSHTIYKYNFKKDITLSPLVDKLYFIAMLISLIVNMIFLSALIFNIEKYRWLFREIDLIKNTGGQYRIAFLIISIISILYHELGHVFAGLHYGKSLESISIHLYAYIMPMCFVKFKGLNLLRAKKRLRVIGAGIYNNITLSSTSGLIIPYLSNEVHIGYFKIIFYGNLIAALANLIPVSLSDGYFLFSLLFDVHDTKDRFIKGNLFSKGSRKSLKSFVVGILLIGLAFISYILLALSTFRIVSMITLGPNNRIKMLVFLIWGIYIFYAILLSYRQIKKVRGLLL